MTLWTADEIARVTGGHWVRPPGQRFSPTSVMFSKKYFSPGTLAVPAGEAADPAVAERFARRGAAAIVTSRDLSQALEPYETPWMRVEDPHEARLALARAARARLGPAARVFGVTGSVGKTTTRHIIRHLLAQHGLALTNPGNYNCIEGCGSTLASSPPSAIGVSLEMAITFHHAEIAAISKLARPHVALVTAIEAAHLDFYGSTAGVARQKAGIFAGLEPEGVAVICKDALHADILVDYARRCGVERVLTYGRTVGADLRLLGVEEIDGTRRRVRVEVQGEPFDFEVSMKAEHNVINALGALLAVDAAGWPMREQAPALADFQPPGSRLLRQSLVLPDGRTIDFLDDSFNAAPASMLACLATIAAFEPGPGARKIVALGDMARLAEHSERYHRELAEPLLAARVDRLYGVGHYVRALGDQLSGRLEFVHLPSAEDLAARLLEDLRDGDVLALKGSLPSRLEVTAKALRAGVAPAPGLHSLPEWRRLQQAFSRHSAVVWDCAAGEPLVGHRAVALQPPGRFLARLALLDLALGRMREQGLSASHRVPVTLPGPRQRPLFGLEHDCALGDVLQLLTFEGFADVYATLARWLAPQPDDLVAALNERARAVGAVKTKFLNDSGVIHREQVTTVSDIGRWMAAILHEHGDAALAYLGARECEVDGRYMRTAVTYAFRFDDFLGGMSGANETWTHSLVVVRRDGRDLAVVVYWSPSQEAADFATRQLLELQAEDD